MGKSSFACTAGVELALTTSVDEQALMQSRIAASEDRACNMNLNVMNISPNLRSSS